MSAPNGVQYVTVFVEDFGAEVDIGAEVSALGGLLAFGEITNLAFDQPFPNVSEASNTFGTARVAPYGLAFDVFEDGALVGSAALPPVNNPIVGSTLAVGVTTYTLLFPHEAATLAASRTLAGHGVAPDVAAGLTFPSPTTVATADPLRAGQAAEGFLHTAAQSLADALASLNAQMAAFTAIRVGADADGMRVERPAATTTVALQGPLADALGLSALVADPKSRLLLRGTTAPGVTKRFAVPVGAYGSLAGLVTALTSAGAANRVATGAALQWTALGRALSVALPPAVTTPDELAWVFQQAMLAAQPEGAWAVAFSPTLRAFTVASGAGAMVELVGAAWAQIGFSASSFRGPAASLQGASVGGDAQGDDGLYVVASDEAGGNLTLAWRQGNSALRGAFSQAAQTVTLDAASPSPVFGLPLGEERTLLLFATDASAASLSPSQAPALLPDPPRLVRGARTGPNVFTLSDPPALATAAWTRVVAQPAHHHQFALQDWLTGHVAAERDQLLEALDFPRGLAPSAAVRGGANPTAALPRSALLALFDSGGAPLGRVADRRSHVTRNGERQISSHPHVTPLPINHHRRFGDVPPFPLHALGDVNGVVRFSVFDHRSRPVDLAGISGCFTLRVFHKPSNVPQVRRPNPFEEDREG